MTTIPTLQKAALRHVDIVAAAATRKLTDKEKLAELQHDASMLRRWSDLLITQQHVGALRNPGHPHLSNEVGVAVQAEAHTRVAERQDPWAEVSAWRANYEARSPDRNTPKSTLQVRLTDAIYCRTIEA